MFNKYLVAYFSAEPLPCGDDCTCHYNLEYRANIFSCSGPHRTSLPVTSPRFSNWIEVKETNVKELCGAYPYLQPDAINIRSLSLKGSSVSKICDDTLDSILHTPNLISLDLSQNSLTLLSQKFQSDSNNLDRLLLGGNPYNCRCDMIWMADWIVNATTSSGARLVKDYETVKCDHGLLQGTPIYKLHDSQLGCVPKILSFPTWGIIGLCIVFIIVILAMTGYAAYRKNDLRFWVYNHFRIPGNQSQKFRRMDNTVNQELGATNISNGYINNLNSQRINL